MTDGADFQRRSSQEGRQANEIAGQVLAGAGFTISRRNFRLPDIGITANYIALDLLGDEWLFDVAGSFTSADTARRARQSQVGDQDDSLDGRGWMHCSRRQGQLDPSRTGRRR